VLVVWKPPGNPAPSCWRPLKGAKPQERDSTGLEAERVKGLAVLGLALAKPCRRVKTHEWMCQANGNVREARSVREVSRDQVPRGPKVEGERGQSNTPLLRRLNKTLKGHTTP